MAEKKFGSTMQTLDRLKKSGDLAALTRKNKPAQAGQRDIPLDDIVPDPEQPRRHFDKDQLASLAESIRIQGVLQAITVQPADEAGKHVLIMGERRFQAAKLAGLIRIPAVVREMTDALRMAQLTENVQRADLTTLEVAEAVAAMRAAGQSRSAIAEALGWNEGEVSRFAALAKMPDVLRDAAARNAPIRALSDLNTLWKKDEAAVRQFLSESEAGDISRVSVERLRAEIEAKQAAHNVSATAPIAPEGPQVESPKQTPDASLETAEVAGQGSAPVEAPAAASQTVPRPRVVGASPALLVRHAGQLGQALLDQPASNTKSLLIRFEGEGRLAEVPLAEVELVELLRD
ncbi:ParB/RepB/Spo0J family partition protein [Salipiger bermudensis]|uniref:Chromosome partitioning protein, ParB n=1 Tax=Salipiger bermudensis (strain DSM 26914 / JCM 13377 / KCTC 12554 / HTCC2601) TaxID=314265 RepID=Q0FJD9_SALBH|nr:ParB/RepB/Spo0J family partition protein [Salipiger bermudensis]EAU44337.1 chromosome partitioning protein, ParB [Salipiger bermudensis HTCC2601]